jgi:hypothetical protein
MAEAGEVTHVRADEPVAAILQRRQHRRHRLVRGGQQLRPAVRQVVRAA